MEASAMSLPDETPLFIPDPFDEPREPRRSRARRSRQGEWTVFWIALGIVGLGGVGYAVHLALDSTPTPTTPATTPPSVVAAPPTTASNENFGDDYVRKEAERHRRSELNKRDDARLRKAAKAREDALVEHVREPDPPPLPPDDANSFNSGAAFDRPAVGNASGPRRGDASREFRTFQAPAPARGSAELSDRPNRPDPSFDDVPEGRTMRKNRGRP
jgi:hypothetical protein